MTKFYYRAAFQGEHDNNFFPIGTQKKHGKRTLTSRCLVKTAQRLEQDGRPISGSLLTRAT